MTPIYIPVIKPGKYTFIGFFKDPTKLSHWQTRTVEISQDEITELDIHKGYGSLKITSEPDSAIISVPRVRYGGRGVTPFVHNEIMIGEYNVEVIYPNGQYSQKRIIITENELTEHKFIVSKDDILYDDILIDFSLDNVEEEIKEIPIVVEDIIIDSEDYEDFEITIMNYQEEVIEEEVEEEAIPFQLVEEEPSFQGGDAQNFSKWVNQRLVYPEIAKENGVQGRVVLEFTVEKDGRITNVKVLRGVDPSLDREAVRVVSSSPRWKPGKEGDRAVPVTYTFPVIFQLR
jgi:TonB family protein